MRSWGCCPTCANARHLREERDRLRAEFGEAFDALRAADLRHDADHPVAVRYREASNAVNHANRRLEGAVLDQLN